MTKKQVLFSLRERIKSSIDRAERLKSKEVKGSDLYEYFQGRIDSCEFILDCLLDYE